MRYFLGLLLAFALANSQQIEAAHSGCATGGQGKFSEMAIRTLIGEASGEGERGMQAVAEVIRRRGSLKGFYGLNAPHVDKQPAWVWKRARKAWEASKTSNITNFATHFESKDFKTPYWAKGRQPCAVIGKHLFYRI